MTILNKLRSHAERTPERIAYESAGRALTYGALWTGAAQLAAALRKRDASRVVLLGEKEPEQVIGMIACLMAGKTYLPVTRSTPPERIRQILAAVGPCVVLSEQPAPELVPACSVSALMARAADPMDPMEYDVPETTPAYMIFTSGSTGVPKGVPILRESLEHFAAWISGLEALQLEAPARVLNQASFSFDLSVADLYYSLCGGHTLIALPPELVSEPTKLYGFLIRQEPDAAVCTPTFLKLCLLDETFSGQFLPRLRVIYSCGEPLEKRTAQKLLDRFPALRLINAYGPTEAASAVCAVEISRELLEKDGPLPVGRTDTAACGITVENGELVLQGTSVFSGYFNADSDACFLRSGARCFRTGDLGRIEDGLIYCLGRRDRQVKWKGYRIELDEIEQAASEVPGVLDCAVVADRTGEGIVRGLRAFVCLDEGTTVSDLRTVLQSRLPAYMIPRSFRVLDALPMTNNGKTDRKRLEAL